MSHAQGNRPHILRRRSNATLASFCRSLPLYQWPLLLFFLLLVFLLSQLQSEVRASSSSGSCLFPAVDNGGQIKDGLPPPSAVTSPTSLLSMLFGDQQPFRPSEDRQSAQQQIDPFSLQECACEPDWTDAFCGRMAHYEKMPASKVPSVCVCRQVTGPRQCRQFLSRCFQQPTSPSQQQKFGGNSTIQIQQHRPLARSSKCSCCFNQPDAFCTQIDCLQMRPQFDAQAKTSCRCFAPAATTADREDPATMAKFPPDGLCTQFSQHWPRWAEPQQPVGVQGGEAEDEQQALSFAVFSRPSSSSSASSSSESGLTKLFRSSAPYARLVSLLLLALLASLLLALAVCFWSHWRRLRRGRRKAKVEAEQQPATLETDQQAEAALLDEIALGAESAVERATEEGSLGIERNGGGVRLQEATV